TPGEGGGHGQVGHAAVELDLQRVIARGEPLPTERGVRGFSVEDVQRLGGGAQAQRRRAGGIIQVDIGHRVHTVNAQIGNIQHEVGGQFALHRYIPRFGIRVLEIEVDYVVT